MDMEHLPFHDYIQHDKSYDATHYLSKSLLWVKYVLK